MSTVLNRTTKRLIQSANTPDYPTADWIINPDLSAVAGVNSKYWKISGDVVSEMSAGEKTTEDDVVANVDVTKATKLAAIDDKTLSLIYAGEDHVAATIRILKTAVNAAATKAAVDAVVDSR